MAGLTLPRSEYKRDLDFVKYYMRDASKYASLMEGISEEEALEYIKQIVSPSGKYPLFNPRLAMLDSTKQGFRDKVETTVLDFMRDVTQKRYIMAATFTCYRHPDEMVSPSAEYIIGELANRTKNKQTMAMYDLKGDKKMKRIYNNRQNRNKIKCNSVSGGHGTKSSVLFQQTAHSTLTSTCRSGTQNTASLIEKFVTGNRHYTDADCVKQNIISICNLTDLDLVREAMEHYNLVYPTVDDVYAHILRSTKLYWTSKDMVEEKRIRLLLTKLSRDELAAVMYVSDFYALKELNEDFVRSFITKLHAPNLDERIDNPDEYISKLSGADRDLLGVTANCAIQHRGLKDETLKADPEAYSVVGATAKRISETMGEIHLLARAFWMTRNMPPSVAKFPRSIRKSVIASDTDSAIFTTQHWTEWFVGRMDFGVESAGVASSLTFLCSLVTEHLLMQMMANFGSAEQHITEFQMKNEYYFKFFALTTMAKHYFASKDIKEGVVYRTPDWEIKGAQLKNSNAPVELVERAEEVIKEIATTIISGETVDIEKYMKEFAERERHMMEEIRKGSIDFFGRARIKPRDSYSETATHSPYDHYVMWQEVFAPKYGDVSEPPYAAVKVNIQTDSPTKLREWLDGIEDQEFVNRFLLWQAKTGKKQLTTVYLPVDIIATKSIPVEVEGAMDVRGMVFKLMRTFYLLLETFCVFMINNHQTRMLSDMI